MKYLIVIAMAIILIGTNLGYYFITKSTLIAAHEKELDLAVKSIQTSIETTQRGEILFETSIADQLKTASIAIQRELPNDHEKVTNEQLVALSNKFGLEGITLFKQTPDDFEAVKSSDPKEVGLKTKDWGGGIWNQMFSQLMEKHDVTLMPNFGEKLKNFWSGPMDTSSADPNLIQKWGYYNDGTTNYLLDPYVSDKNIKNFQKEAGANKTIEKALEENKSLVEVSVVNNELLEGIKKAYSFDNVVWNSERLVLYGTYNFKDKQDVELSQKAFDTLVPTQTIKEINGKTVLKSYIPITLSVNVSKGYDKIIIMITSDYDMIRSQLIDHELNILIVSMLFFLIGFLVIFFVIRLIERKNQALNSVEQVFSENIKSLYNTVREHRHDFTNHIFTIMGLLHSKSYEELSKYVSGLSEIEVQFNDIVQINIPALSGLLHAKVAQASEKQVEFEYHFEGFECLNLNAMKTADLVRIVGNIIDNAFDAVSGNSLHNRKIGLVGKVRNGELVINIYNNGELIPEDKLDQIFTHGFSTKIKKSNHGLGLSIVTKILSKYNGDIDVKSNSDLTIFKIILPLSRKEYMSVA